MATPKSSTKVCPVCDKEFPRTVEFFGTHASKGIQSYCRKCQGQANLSRYQKNTANQQIDLFSAAPKCCSKCRITKPITEFGRESRQKDGRRVHCLACVRLHVNEYRHIHPSPKPKPRERERIRRYKIKLRYDMTWDDYEKLLAQQNGGCAICGSAQAGGRWNSLLHVDHDHNTGKVRGLLCNNCNVLLGRLHDDLIMAKNVVKYLEESQCIP